jgi:hypothetical protein
MLPRHFLERDTIVVHMYMTGQEKTFPRCSSEVSKRVSGNSDLFLVRKATDARRFPRRVLATS